MVKKNLLISLYILCFFNINYAQNQIEWRQKVIDCKDTAPNNKALKDCLALSIEHLGKQDSLTALIYHKIGVKYFLNNEPYQAIVNWKKALSIREKLYSNPFHLDIGMGKLNVCIAYIRRLNQIDKTYPLLMDAATIFKKDGTRPDKLAQVYQYLGEYFEKKGDFNQMNKYFDLAFSPAQESGRQRLIGQIYEAKGKGYNSQENPELAHLAIENFENALDVYKANSDLFLFEIAVCYQNIGNSWLIKKNNKKAIEYIKKAISLFYQIEDWRSLSIAHNNLAIIYNRMKEFEKAKSFLRQSIKISQQHKNYWLLAINYDNLADSYLYQNVLDSALYYYQICIITSITGYDNLETSSNPDLTNENLFILSKPDLFTYLSDKAKAQTILGKSKPEFLKLALSTYHTADQLLSLLKQDLSTQQSQLFWREKAAPLYQNAFQLAHQLYEKTNEAHYLQEMFFFSEKSKANILFDAFANVQAQNDIIPTEYLEQEKQIKTQLGTYERQVASEETEEGVNALDSLIYYRNQHQQFIEKLEKAFPTYHQLKYQNKTPDLAEVQQQLAAEEKTGLLEYFVTTNTIFLFAITPKQVQLFSFPKTIGEEENKLNFDAFMNEYYIALSQEGSGKTYLNGAYTFYQNWLEPALKALPTNIEQLLIIPDDKLHYVPFEALLTEPYTEQGVFYKNLPYLIQKYQCNYNYSAALWQQLQKSEWTIDFPFLGFAPTFEDLQFNQKSVQKIHKIVGGQIFIKAGEDKKSILQDWKQNVKVLHFGTHAAANDEEPLNCYIQLDTNLLLTTPEIYNLPFKTELVVLAACETGIGQLKKGEGMMSLGRAFMYSGSPSVVSSLWKVDDEKTNLLMEDFYKNLKEGMNKDAALNQAKLAYLNLPTCEFENPHWTSRHYWMQKMGWSKYAEEGDFNPYYWSAFVHNGNTEEIDFPFWETKWWLILIGVGGLIGLFWWRRF